MESPQEAMRRLCMVLEPIHQRATGESKKIEKLTHANTVLYRAYNTLTEKLQASRRELQEKEAEATGAFARMEQEKQVLQWHLNQLNRPERL